MASTAMGMRKTAQTKYEETRVEPLNSPVRPQPPQAEPTIIRREMPGSRLSPGGLTRGKSFADIKMEVAGRKTARVGPVVAYASDLASIQNYQKRAKFVIDPATSGWMKRWDIWMMCALAFTAIVTPVEVSFVEDDGKITPLWWINRFIDLSFITDIIITFNLAFEETVDQGGSHYVYSRRRIVRNYLSGWFVIDFVSVLPFFLITLDKEDPFGVVSAVADQSADQLAASSGGAAGSLTRASVLFRIVKLLRMIKLARMFKAARVFERTVLDVLLHHWEWTYAVLKLLKFCMWLSLFAHFQACVWGLVSSFLPAPTWISEFEASYAAGEGDGAKPAPLDKYAAALYWSVMTLTSIGYGEMTPVNSTERWLCSLYMMFSGVIWTYAIGSVAAIATTLNPDRVDFENTMDQLNFFMRERALPFEMRTSLRDFFKSAKRVNQLTNDSDLMSKLTPELQSTIALAANRQWLGQVWFCRELWHSREGVAFIAALAQQLTLRNFVGSERVPVGMLCIVRKGLVVKMWRFLGAKKVWGEDFILEDEELIDHSQAVAISYVELYTLRRTALRPLLCDHPHAQHVVRRNALRITLQRSLLRYLTLQNGGVSKGPRSFVLKSKAHDPEIESDLPSMEDKVDTVDGKLDGMKASLEALQQRMDKRDNEMAELTSLLKTLVERDGIAHSKA